MKIDAISSAPASFVADSQTPAAVKAGATDEPKNGDKKTARLIKSVEILNDNAEANERQIRFAFYKDTHRIFVEVVDKETNQVVVTYPPEQILQMAEALQQQSKDRTGLTGKEVE